MRMQRFFVRSRCFDIHRSCRYYYVQSRDGFGSFHSGDVEDLIRASDDHYQVPEIYNTISSTPLFGNRDIVFGKNCMNKIFLLDSSWCFINHGAFGAATSFAVHECNKWSELCEQQPLRFFDRVLLPMTAYVLRKSARYLKCDPTELIPLANVTSGINAIVESVNVSSKDEIVCFNVTYGSTKKILKRKCAQNGALYREISLRFPVESNQCVLDAVNSFLSSTSNVKLVVLDHITSNTAFKMPIIELAQIFRNRCPSAIIVVDAAHSLLSQEVSFDDHSFRRNVDLWITNCHKWFCSPKGAALAWVSPLLAGRLRPAIISHGFIPNSLANAEQYCDPKHILSGFSWDGCRNYSAILTLPSIWRFWEEEVGGISRVRQHIVSLNQKAVSFLIHDWNLRQQDFLTNLSLRQDLPMNLV